MRTTLASVVVGIAGLAAPALGGDGLPKAAPGWAVEKIADAPAIRYPTALVVASDGTIYLGQDPMDMTGPATKPIDSVVAIRGQSVTTYAEGLHAVMGLEWLDGTLFVVHTPFLSAFADADGDGRADRRVDLVVGLGPADPASNGLNDHVASGLRLGLDGFLYVAVGDKGIAAAVGKDGAKIRMKGGGVVRVRPDGTGLEIVATGERNPLSVALSDRDDAFTYGNDDDSHAWPNSLTHQIVGGHYGYPYEFLSAPWRALPIMAGQVGGAGAQAICYGDDGLPPRFKGNLIACDWGLQGVFRHEIARAGATFKVVRREAILTRGDRPDFRPFAVAVDADRASLLVSDWACNGWLVDGPPTGRLYRLRYVGKDAARPAPTTGDDLDHPARSVRLAAQRRLARDPEAGRPALLARLATKGRPDGRVHALWGLDAIGGPDARGAIRRAIDDDDPEVRVEAIRSAGIRRDPEAGPAIVLRLKDSEPRARREAAIALSRIGLNEPGSLYAAIGDPDRFVAWSVRAAIRRLGAWSTPDLVAALADPRRRDDALALADESWSPPAIDALALALAAEADAGVRARIVANLAGQYRKAPAWDGRWFGPNPLAAPAPAKTENWDPAAMNRLTTAMVRSLVDPDAPTRRQAIVGLAAIGPRAAATFLAAIPREADPINRAALIKAVGRWGHAPAVPTLAALLGSGDQPLDVRIAALDALGGIETRRSSNARFAIVFDPKAPPDLVARALPALGRAGSLPPNDLADFLDAPDPAVRAAAMAAIGEARKVPPDLAPRLLARLDDPAEPVRNAAAAVAGRLGLREAIPRLVVLAKAEDSRAEATRALAAMPDPRGLDAYLAAVDDPSPDLRRLGEAALLAIRDAARPEIARRARSGRLRGRSALVIERLLADFRPVVAWKVIGPFPRATSPALLTDPSIDFLRTREGVAGRPIAWADRAADPATGMVLIDDLRGAPDGASAEGEAAFAFAEVTSSTDRSALLLLGASGGLVVALNGTIVAEAADPDLVRVKLRAGANRLVVRARRGVDVWRFSVAVSEPGEASLALANPSASIDSLRAFALGHLGDPKKGETLFFDPKGIGCASCHTAGGRGESRVGPDLTGLAAKYDKAEIIRSVLEPSSRVAPGYQPLVVATSDGRVVTGLLRAETDESIDLVDAEARPVRLAKSTIVDRRVSSTSIMPVGPVASLAPVDFADLVAYLQTLTALARP